MLFAGHMYGASDINQFCCIPVILAEWTLPEGTLPAGWPETPTSPHITSLLQCSLIALRGAVVSM